jgi:hypothetical protein
MGLGPLSTLPASGQKLPSGIEPMARTLRHAVNLTIIALGIHLPILGATRAARMSRPKPLQGRAEAGAQRDEAGSEYGSSPFVAYVGAKTRHRGRRSSNLRRRWRIVPLAQILRVRSRIWEAGSVPVRIAARTRPGRGMDSWANQPSGFTFVRRARWV